MARIVCAAIRHRDGTIVCGARHFDDVMRATIKKLGLKWTEFIDQGFIDSNSNYLSRKEAWVVADREGQIINRCGGDTDQLWSENLY